MKQRSSLSRRNPTFGGGFEKTLRNIDHSAFRTWYDRTTLVDSIGSAR